MASLRIRLCGVNDNDMTSLRSMLQLSDKRLNSEWTVANTGRTDLYLYSIESEESLLLLQQHKKGFSAILSNKSDTHVSADFLIKKPLRSKQLAETLNAVEEKLVFANQADKVANIPKTPANPVKPKTKKDPSLLATISKHIAKRRSPAADLPPLDIHVPELSVIPLKTLLVPTALSAWMKSLPADNTKVSIAAFLEKLIALNRTEMPVDNRLALLECYHKPIRDFIFSRDVETINLEMSEPTAFKAEIKQLSLFLEELTAGYKLILMTAYQYGLRPNLSDTFLFAIIRTAELISLSVVHTFRHYLVTPIGAIHDFHQLYLYCEASEVLNKKASFNKEITKKAFLHFYNQLMLTGIADPYSLDKYDIFRLYVLMGKMADKVEISPLTSHQKDSSNTTVLNSSFCIDCTSDHLPIPLHHMAADKRQLAKTRMINPQGVLLSIEQVFQAAASITDLVAFELDIQILKRVLPQFDANYQRQFQRLATVPHRQVRLADGITAIHHCLNNDDSDFATEWTIRNQGTGGMMVRCDKKEVKTLTVGDFMGLFEHGLSPRLATIRWLQIATDDTLMIGLQIYPGSPSAVHLTVDGKTTVSAGLLLPKNDDTNQDETIIVEKGVYSPQRLLRVKDVEKNYAIVAQQLLNNTLNYEQFSFKIKTNTD